MSVKQILLFVALVGYVCAQVPAVAQQDCHSKCTSKRSDIFKSAQEKACQLGCKLYETGKQLIDCKNKCGSEDWTLDVKNLITGEAKLEDCIAGCDFAHEVSTTDEKPNVDVKPPNDQVKTENIQPAANENDDNESSSEEDKTEFNINDWVPVVSLEQPKPIDNGGLPPAPPSTGDAATATNDNSNSLQNVFDFLAPILQKINDITGKQGGNQVVYTEEEKPDGQVQANLQAFDKDGKLISSQTDDQPLFGPVKPISGKGRPMPIGKPFIVPIQPQDANNKDDSLVVSSEMGPKGRPLPFNTPLLGADGHDMRVCIMPMQLRFSSWCRDINNIFNCVSARTGLPRWALFSIVMLTNLFMLWLGIFILSVARRMHKRQRRVRGYLPLYKDIDFSIEPAGALPEKEALLQNI